MARTEIERIQTVTVKELAYAAGVSEHTILRRLRLWEADPCAPQGIPYLRRLGKPYRIPAAAVRELLTSGSAA